MTNGANSLDLEVAGRFDLLMRFSRAIRHDLGNVIYPSSKLLLRARSEGEAGEELAGRVTDLMDMMGDAREALARMRPLESADCSGALVAAEWWAETKPLLRGAVRSETQVSGPRRVDRALPVGARGLTLLSLSVLLAADLQIENAKESRVLFDHIEGRDALSISIDANFLSPPVVPKMAHELAERLGATVETEYTAPRWEIALSWD